MSKPLLVSARPIVRSPGVCGSPGFYTHLMSPSLLVIKRLLEFARLLL